MLLSGSRAFTTKLFRALGRNFSAICGEVENPKSEARNPKQNPMIQIRMTKTMPSAEFLF
jgi:hypothetical protein